MDTLRRLLPAAAVALLLVVVAAPALAVEVVAAPGLAVEVEPALAVEQQEKIQLPDRPREQAGAIVLVASALFLVLAADNVRRQLKGERKQATGEWRYR